MNSTKKITHIPFQGSSGVVPSGAIQFQDDWPGLFLRGDSASSLLATIRGLQQRLVDHPDPVVQAALLQLKDVATMIEHDVLIKQ